LVENSVLLVLWALSVSDHPPPFWPFILIGQPVLFIIGFALLVFYFKSEKLNENDPSAYFGLIRLCRSINYIENV
jgi:hypothetical protein